LDLKLTKIY